MASIYDLKPKFQSLLRPLCRGLANAGITANQVTVAALLLSIAAGGAVAMNPTASWPLLAIPAVLLIRMALNVIDGMLAREHDMQSPLGAVLNELGDVVSDAALFLPLAVVPGVPAGWIVAIVVLAIISEMTGVIAVQIGASRRYDGPMGKSDRAFIVGAMCLAIGLGATTERWLTPLLIIVTAMTALTIVIRARRALAEVA